MSDATVLAGAPPSPPAPPSGIATSDGPEGRPRRVALPKRRPLVTIGFEFEGFTYHLGLGPYPDGRIGEIWLATVKASSQTEATARDVAIAISVALQCGMAIETFQAAVQRRPDGGPSSLLGAVLDLIVAEGFA